MPPKGKTNNPSGRPALPWDVLLAKKRLRADYDRVVCRLLCLKLKEIDDIVSNPDGEVFERIVAKVIQNLVAAADIDDLEQLMNRPLGKPIDAGEMVVRETAELAKQMIEMTDEERIRLIEVRLDELKANVAAKALT